MISVAIDGPSGAGKGSVASAAAKELGYLYVDTGAFYRAIGLYALRQGVDPRDEAGVTALLPSVELTILHEGEKQFVCLNGENVDEAIRSHEISDASSGVSAHPAVRQFLLDLQHKFAREHDVIMDGRDIGTVILPSAEVKIFLTASDEKRAERRWLELREKGEHVTVEEVLSDMRRRDAQDSSRAAAPLRRAEDAVLVDTSALTLEESIQAVLDVIRGRMA